MAVIKRAGNLFEQESIQDRVKKLDLGNTPTTPAAADALGASPHASKMAGTPAQKQAVIKEQMKPQQTLAGAQRQEAPTEVREADVKAQEKAQQLSQLGSLGMRVQSRVEGMIQESTQGLATGQISADDENIAATLGYTPEQAMAAKPQIDNIKNLANTYVQNPTEAGLIALMDAGLSKTQVYQMTGLLEDGAQATGDTIAGAMADEVLVGDMDMAELGFGDVGELSSLLGQDVSGMTIPQLQDSITALQGAEFDRAEELRSQLRGLPAGSARAEILRRELADMGDVGRTGAEAQVEEAAKAVDMAQSVKFGDQEYDVSELLEDNMMSEIIQDYIRMSPEEREELLPAAQYSGLRDWIDANQEALGTLTTAAEDTQEDFQQANEDWADMEADTGLSPELMEALGADYDPDRTVTSAQVAETKALIEGTGIGQLAKDPDNQLLIANIDDSNRDMLKDWDAETIQKSYATSTSINDSIGLSALTGAGGKQFATIEDMQAAENMKEAAEALDKLTLGSELISNPKFLEGVKNGTISPDWLDTKYEAQLNNPEVVSLINSGHLTADNRDEALNDFDNKFQAYQTQDGTKDQIEQAYKDGRDIDSMLDAIFGTDINPDEIEGYLEDAKIAAKLGDSTADQYVRKYKQLLNPDYLYSTTHKKDTSLRAFLMNGADQMEIRRTDAPKPYMSKNPNLANLFSLMGDDGSIDDGELLSNPSAASHLYSSSLNPNDLGAPDKSVFVSQVLNNLSGEVKDRNIIGSMDRFLDPKGKLAPADIEPSFKEAMSALDLMRQTSSTYSGTLRQSILDRIDKQEARITKRMKRMKSVAERERLAAKAALPPTEKEVIMEAITND